MCVLSHACQCFEAEEPGFLHNCWLSSCFSSAGFAQLPSVFPQIGRVLFFFFLLSNPVCSVASPAYIITVASSTQHDPCSIPPHPTHVQRDIFNVASSSYHHHRMLLYMYINNYCIPPHPNPVFSVASSTYLHHHVQVYIYDNIPPHPTPVQHHQRSLIAMCKCR